MNYTQRPRSGGHCVFFALKCFQPIVVDLLCIKKFWIHATVYAGAGDIIYSKISYENTMTREFQVVLLFCFFDGFLTNAGCGISRERENNNSLIKKRIFQGEVVVTCVKRTWVNGSGSEVAPQAPQTLCSTSVIANFWCGTQCRALHMSSASPLAMCKWILRRMFSYKNNKLIIIIIKRTWSINNNDLVYNTMKKMNPLKGFEK